MNVMRLMKLRLVSAMALSLLVAGSLVQAQEKKEEKPAVPATPKPDAPVLKPATPAIRPESRRALRVEATLNSLTQSLNLTDEQKTKIKPILEEEVIKFEELQQDKTVPPAERSKKFKEVREARQAKIKPLLTAEQQEKLDAFRGGSPRRVAPPAATPAAK